MLIRLSEAVDFLENQKPFQKDFGGLWFYERLNLCDKFRSDNDAIFSHIFIFALPIW